MVGIDSRQIRQKTTRRCKESGFRFAEMLPVRDPADSRLRPLEEIVARLAALTQLCLYVSASPELHPTNRIQRFFKEHDLERHLTGEEASVLAQHRDEARNAHVDSIGWKMENAWPLGWIAGFDAEPLIDGQMIDSDLIQLLRTEFVPTDLNDFALRSAEYSSRPLTKIVQLEDLFYCVHNAVRSAQFPMRPPRWKFWCRRLPTVPTEFDPITNGGVIHERRHALTWALSPGVEWDDTDLST